MAATHSFSSVTHRDEADSYLPTKAKISTIAAREFLKHDYFKLPTLGSRIGISGSLSPLGVRWIKEFALYSSTAAAGEPAVPGGDDKNEESTVKQKKEASPEECDQAVEGLSTVKAKARAKQLQDTQKDEKSIIKRIWAMLLGIGPALRAVASMSRLIFFTSTLVENKKETNKVHEENML